MKSFELVALDVDGTLLNPETQTIAPAVKSALHEVLASGARVVISTGRTFLGTRPILDELGLSDGYALCSNGAVLIDVAAGEPLSVATFDAGPVLSVLAERLPGSIFATEQVGIGSLVTAEFDPTKLHGPQRRATPAELVASPVPRLIAEWVGHRPDEVSEALNGVELAHCTYTLDQYEPWVTVVAGGISKGAALEKLRVGLGIAAERTLAIGDGDNDIEMLRWAGHGVAMGQARSEVLAVADEITESVESDGAATVLQRFFAQ